MDRRKPFCINFTIDTIDGIRTNRINTRNITHTTTIDIYLFTIDYIEPINGINGINGRYFTKTRGRKKKTMTDLKEYHEITTDVWKVFKKYQAADADLNEFAPDVSKLDEKYRDKAGYKFMQDLLKVYFRELNVIRGLRNGDSVEGRT